jgi:peptidoglycan/xylan/chitin deacetylase (PgdA/CDA1 family)
MSAVNVNSDSYIVPILLHKIVTEHPVNWEDVQENVLNQILDFIGDRWVVLNSNTTANSRCWMLTFDDGHTSDYEVVFPLLIDKKVKATFFVIVDRIGSSGYLDWPQILEMHNNGMQIGSHSLTHPRMTTLSEDVAVKEFLQSKTILEDFLGGEVNSFSYPYGDCSTKLHEIAKEVGYRFICTSKHGLYDSSKEIIPRNSINSKMKFKDIVNVMNASIHTQTSWWLEDNLKPFLKIILSRKNYVTLRNAIFHIKQ